MTQKFVSTKSFSALLPLEEKSCDFTVLRSNNRKDLSNYIFAKALSILGLVPQRILLPIIPAANFCSVYWEYLLFQYCL